MHCRGYHHPALWCSLAAPRGCALTTPPPYLPAQRSSELEYQMRLCMSFLSACLMHPGADMLVVASEHTSLEFLSEDVPQDVCNVHVWRPDEVSTSRAASALHVHRTHSVSCAQVATAC